MNSNFPTTDRSEHPSTPTQGNQVKELWSTPTLTKLSTVENTLSFPNNGGDGDPDTMNNSSMP